MLSPRSSEGIEKGCLFLSVVEHLPGMHMQGPGSSPLGGGVGWSGATGLGGVKMWFEKLCKVTEKSHRSRIRAGFQPF